MFSLFRVPRLLSVLLTGLLIIVFHPSAVSAATAPGPLRCVPCELRFGSLRIGESKNLTIAVTNTRLTSVTISSVQKSAPGFTVRGLSLPLTLGAGKTASFNVVFAPRDNRTIQGNLRLVNSASSLLLGIAVSGTGLTSGFLTASPTKINFGSVPLGKGVLQTQSLTNSGRTNVTIVSAGSSGGAFWVSGIATPMTLSPGASVTFYAHFHPKLVGTVSGKVNIVSSATDYAVFVPLSGIATNSGQLSVSPPNVNFGNVVVGSRKSTTATLSARTAAVTINSGILSTSEFSVSGLSMPLTLGAGQTKSFTITFAPQSSGTANASLFFRTDAAGTGSAVSQSLTGSGTATPQHSVSLSWNPSNSQVVGYNIYRGRQTGGPYTRLNSALEGSTTYTDSSVQGGQTYFYVVTAVQGTSMESPFSNQARAAIPSP
jgi:hypothetical protein